MVDVRRIMGYNFIIHMDWWYVNITMEKTMVLVVRIICDR